ncbi:response regulator transcription factor [Actinoplanes subglobosus]|uniref:LuxR C-terminal-related transcriptional regulator n=1 Tax=Actinoplanes subglobosus TaxID=1547892 RepID=A0ABV8J814_9ACTN
MSTEQNPIRVLIADEHPLIRGGLALLLGRPDDIEVVAQAGDAVRAVGLSRTERPDVVVMDLLADGIEATRQIVGSGYARVLALAAILDRPVARRILLAGASGFLLTGADPQVLVTAVRAVAGGGAWLDADLASDLLREYVTRPTAVATGTALLDHLTPRETEVLALVAQGLGNTEIARQLFVAESTVKTHLGRILTKLGLRDRAQAVVAAYRSGLVRVAPVRTHGTGWSSGCLTSPETTRTTSR